MEKNFQNIDFVINSLLNIDAYSLGTLAQISGAFKNAGSGLLPIDGLDNWVEFVHDTDDRHKKPRTKFIAHNERQVNSVYIYTYDTGRKCFYAYMSVAELKVQLWFWKLVQFIRMDKKLQNLLTAIMEHDEHRITECILACDF